MQLNHRKIFKIATLLLTSAIIASVSAATYRYMYIDGNVSISQTGLKWVKGDGAGSAVTIASSTATVSLTVSNGTTTNFTNYLYISNLDASSHSIVVNITHAATSAYYETLGFNITLYNTSTGAHIDTLDALTTDSYAGTIDASAAWHVTFELETKADSTGNSDDFDVQFMYE